MLALRLEADGGFLAAADFRELDADVGAAATQTDNQPTTIGWVSAFAAFGIGYDAIEIAELGQLAPIGLDLTGLEAWLGDYAWAGMGVGGMLDLVILSPGLAGDFNMDGVVDGIDYAIWRETLGSITDSRADANGDQIVNAADLELWKSKFGAQASAAASSTPEPATALAAIPLAIFASLQRWRRRRSRLERSKIT